MPGDLEGSPLLTFFPMPLSSDASLPRGSLGAMMARRFESYKAQVVRPFFKDHFARLDRQIVLVDVLSALHRGAGAVRDLDRAMEGVLKAFRPGTNSWLSLLMGRRIEKVLFAATKADHLPASSHDRLAAILKLIIDEAAKRADTEGAGTAALALSAVRATRETEDQKRRRNAALPQRHAARRRAGRRARLRRTRGSRHLSRRSARRSASCARRRAPRPQYVV